MHYYDELQIHARDTPASQTPSSNARSSKLMPRLRINVVAGDDYHHWTLRSAIAQQQLCEYTTRANRRRLDNRANAHLVLLRLLLHSSSRSAFNTSSAVWLKITAFMARISKRKSSEIHQFTANWNHRLHRDNYLQNVLCNTIQYRTSITNYIQGVS